MLPRGQQELFDSGVLHYYQYAQLYNPNSKIIARTTTQDRMLKSAEYFLAGFLGSRGRRTPLLKSSSNKLGSTTVWRATTTATTQTLQLLQVAAMPVRSGTIPIYRMQPAASTT
jgi:hypothetical protein